MLPTFVITLREGLEAALIVGIIAAFLRTQGRRDLTRWVGAGVGAAALLCLAVGSALRVVSHDLPQRQQEGLETVIGALAVLMVTYMVIWMRRHSRELKGQLEGLAADALDRSSGDGASQAARAMVVMAFLAVLREGFETVVFLLAAFNESHSGTGAPIGAVLGLVVAIGLGYGIYRGGLRLNLSRFFRVTGVVLVLVAAGLVLTALHTAHEAGWLDAGQQSTVDLSWLVRPGSVQASLVTGMLGIQAHPTVIEVAGWLAYLLPVGAYVAWPPARPIRPTVRVRALAACGLAAMSVAGVLVAVVIGHADSGTAATTVATTGGDPHHASVTLSAAYGCVPDRTSFAAGAVTFTVHNVDATAVTEVELVDGDRVIGEKENLPPGFSGSFVATVHAGGYVLACPGATPGRTAITVTGSGGDVAGSPIATLLSTGTRAYARYVDTQVAGLLTAVTSLNAALHGTDLDAAQRAYIAARPCYERIEPVAESFVSGSDDLDADIDARAGDVAASRWRGFHRIEQGLFAGHSLAGLGAVGTRLVADVRRLRTLTTGLTYQPSELANGAQELLDEVAASKISGEEERYSHIDVLDIAANVAGAERAFGELQPALETVDDALADLVEDRFHSLDAALAQVRSTTDPSGYLRYAAVSDTQIRAVTAAVKAVAEPLAQVSSRVAG